MSGDQLLPRDLTPPERMAQRLVSAAVTNAGLTTTDLAFAVSLSVSTINRMLAGAAPVSLALARHVARVTADATLRDWLGGGEPDPDAIRDEQAHAAATAAALAVHSIKTNASPETRRQRCGAAASLFASLAPAPLFVSGAGASAGGLDVFA